jgi:hypothetical protein
MAVRVTRKEKLLRALHLNRIATKVVRDYWRFGISASCWALQRHGLYHFAWLCEKALSVSQAVRLAIISRHQRSFSDRWRLHAPLEGIHHVHSRNNYVIEIGQLS